jgi:hypothetical protein
MRCRESRWRGEPADKPGSVADSHSSRAHVTARLKRPTRGPARAARRGPKTACPPIWSCSGVGFTLPSVLPPTRCALTAPFHPCRPAGRRGLAVYFLWHFPWARTPQALPGTLPFGARTFLPRGFAPEAAAVWPTPHSSLFAWGAAAKCACHATGMRPAIRDQFWPAAAKNPDGRRRPGPTRPGRAGSCCRQ